MKKIIVLFLLCITQNLFSENLDIPIFLESYFGNESYHTSSSFFCDKEVCVARNYIENEEEIFNRGVIFYIKDNGIVPLMYINNNRIINGVGTVLFSENDRQATFYGWKIIINKSLVFTRIGKDYSVADSFTFTWNNQQSSFEHMFIDKSIW